MEKHFKFIKKLSLILVNLTAFSDSARKMSCQTIKTHFFELNIFTTCLFDVIKKTALFYVPVT